MFQLAKPGPASRCAGSFTGVAEGTFYAANLKHAVTVSANDTLCATRYFKTGPWHELTGISPIKSWWGQSSRHVSNKAQINLYIQTKRSCRPRSENISPEEYMWRRQYGVLVGES